MTVKASSSKIGSIQALRALAAILVVLFHGSIGLHGKYGYVFLNNIFISGFAGVDIFFVLSGFIIFYTSSTGEKSFVSFIKKRFFRVYPVYWVVTTLWLLLLITSPHAKERLNLDFSMILGSYALIPQPKYIVGVAWTLAYEVIFYLVFAVTYFKSPKLLFYGFTVWVSLILVFQFFKIKLGFFAIDSIMNPIILEFIFGCLVAYIYKRYSCLTDLKWLFWLGLLLFFIASVVYQQNVVNGLSELNGNMQRVYFFGIPASLLILGILYQTWSVPKMLIYLGDASYSVYLMHSLVISILIKLLELLGYASNLTSFAGAVTLFLCTIAISCCFYSIVEKSLLNYIYSKKLI